jgi:hypothetical protein
VTQQQVHFRVFLNSFAFTKGIVHLITRVDEFDEFVAAALCVPEDDP